MSKRTKYVYSSSQEVYHLWAAQSQDYARQGGRIRRALFSGTSCYSYGTHYEVGRLVQIKGHTVALINRSGYSNTTAKHIAQAAGATSHMLQIAVDHTFDWRAGLLKMQGDLIDCVFNTLNRRKFYSKRFDEYSGIREDIADFNKVCSALDLEHLELHLDQDTLDVLNAHVREGYKKTEAKNAIEAAKREVERLKRVEEAKVEIEAWKRGGPFTSALYSVKPELIRVHGDEVETSSQARVALSEARDALRAILSKTLKRGDKIGDYTFDSLDGDVVTIGCHKISLKQAREALESPKGFKLIAGGKS